MLITCVRREAKNRWERRTPLTPEAVKRLVEKGLPIWVESCGVRIFPDDAYADAGATIVNDGGDAGLILGIKEPLIAGVHANQVHVAFSHTIKGQAYNMDLLKAFLTKRCTLIDYETMRDDQGSRVIAFGRYAGIAGAVDALHLMVRKWQKKGKSTNLVGMGMTYEYGTVEKLRASLIQCRPIVGEPLQVLIVGTGKVGRGCVEVCQWLGLPRISAETIRVGNRPQGNWYAVAKTEDIFHHSGGEPYDQGEFRKYGAERYESIFHQYLGNFNLLLQTSYWENHYPYQLPRKDLITYRDQLPLVIGDISCDIQGSLACTLQATTIDKPGMTYLPEAHRLIDGISWEGPTIMSIDHLPCELSLDASKDFSKILEPLVPMIARMSLDKPLPECGMSKPLQAATIVLNGELTPNYAYLLDFLAV